MNPRNHSAPSPARLARRGWVLAVALAALPLVGCVYRLNIPQGNFLEQKTADQVQVGMTRAQVRFLLGTPQVPDLFNNNRWEYLYLYHDGKSRKTERRELVVHFGDDKVVKIDLPTGALPNDAPRAPVNGALVAARRRPPANGVKPLGLPAAAGRSPPGPRCAPTPGMTHALPKRPASG